MDILFLQKPFFMEPLGIMYLSASLKQGGHNTLLASTDDNVPQIIKDYNPQIIASSVMTGDHTFYNKLVSELKLNNPSTLFVAGGPHPTFFPAYLEKSSFDAIGRGECESAFLDFCDTLEKGGDVTKIKNFWIRNKDGEIVKNNVRPLESNLDNLPFPDREILDGFEIITKTPISHFIASRGCPYNCSYCFNHSLAKLYQDESNSPSRVRFRSVGNLCDEIKKVSLSNNMQLVYFQDDTFTLNRKFLNEFLDSFSFEVGSPYHCHVRANTLDKKTAELLKESGCLSVHMALETANDNLRNNLLKRNMTKNQIISASKILKDNGIKLMLQNMIGLPDSTLKDDLETLELNQKIHPDVAWVSIFQPYPGTALGNYCLEKKLCTEEVLDNIGQSFFVSSVLNFSEERKTQLHNLQRLFGLLVEAPFLSDPEILMPLLNTQRSSDIDDLLFKIIRGYRKEGDKRMFGLDLPTYQKIEIKK